MNQRKLEKIRAKMERDFNRGRKPEEEKLSSKARAIIVILAGIIIFILIFSKIIGWV
jgi:hypothetical protein